MQQKIIIFKRLEDLHKYCARQFIEVVRKNPEAKLGFATGVSPLETYKLIVQDYKDNQTNWSKIKTFNLDEFVGIDPAHHEAFINQMDKNLFRHLNLKMGNIFLPHTWASDPDEEAKSYEHAIKAFGPIDLQYASLGINGHVAYNEPGESLESSTHVATLTKETILDMVKKNKFDSWEKSPKKAITMGIKTLLEHTKKILMVSYGKHKAAITKAMLEDKVNSQVTASALRFHQNCEFILDQGAASLLSEATLDQAIWR